MAEIFNLRQARKRRDRTEREAVATANRALHGRTKAEKLRDRAQSEAAERHLAGHKLDLTTPGTGDDSGN